MFSFELIFFVCNGSFCVQICIEEMGRHLIYYCRNMNGPCRENINVWIVFNAALHTTENIENTVISILKEEVCLMYDI